MESALFSLSPEDSYLVVDVHIRGRDRRIADAYYFDNFGDEVEGVLPHALAHAGTVTHTFKLRKWLNGLCACPELWRVTHPQLSQPLGILEFTLAQALEAFYPDLRIDWTPFTGGSRS
ncbi:hypothetical protein H483_0117385 [Dietzia sp. UCD-THP]|nr:hypothetical protein H483_0117385 [Dietzia sp. UCD-THP]